MMGEARLHATNITRGESVKGNELFISRPSISSAAFNGAPIELHRLWDGIITSSGNINRIRNIASDLLRRFSASNFRELDHPDPELRAKESYEIAVKVAYENGSLRGTPKGPAKDCRAVNAVTYLRNGYAAEARLIANRRMYLAGYRLADLLRTIGR